MKAKIGETKFYLNGRELVLTHEEAKELKSLLDDMFEPKGPTMIPYPLVQPCTWPNCPYSQPWGITYTTSENKIADGSVFYPTRDLCDS